MKGKSEDGNKAERRPRRFLMCFRSPVIATDSPKYFVGRPSSSDPVVKAFNYFSNEETSSLEEKKKKQSVSEDLSEGRRRKFRALSGIKAAIFGSKGTSRSGKVQQDPSRSSDASKIVYTETIQAEIHQQQPPKASGSITHKTDSNSGTPSSSSSCSVFGASKTSSYSTRRGLDSPASSAGSQESVHFPSPLSSDKKTLSPASRRELDPIIGLCYLLAISLLTSLIWGQIPAVICTSIWLYFFGQTRGRLWPGSRRRSECLSDPSDIRSDYHKRVIMEGILDRRHRRHHHHHRSSSPANQ